MNTYEFLSYLRSRDIRLSVQGERLRCNAPRGVLTRELRAELAERKAEILVFFREAGQAASSTLPPIVPVRRDGDLPLSLNQQRIWFLEQLEPGSPTYNIPMPSRIKGKIDVEALRRSLNEIVRRHEILRTAFPAVEGEPRQVVAPNMSLDLPVIDLRDLPPGEREAEVRRRGAEEERRPFDLARGPLLRTQLLRLSDDEHVFFLTVHHIAFDVWSHDVFARELAALYEAFSSGKPSPLPELPIQYVDFAHWQREWLDGELLRPQIAYWKKQLQGAPSQMELPLDRPRPPVQTSRGATETLSLPPGLYDSLEKLGREEGCSLFMTLVAAFKAFLCRYTGQTDIVLGSPIANRTRPELEELIGFFVNSLVLRTNLAGDPTFRELMSRVRDVALGAYAHQHLPFEKLVEELQPKREMSHTPLFQVLFLLEHLSTTTTDLSGAVVTPMGLETRAAKVDVSVYNFHHDGRLTSTFEYNTDLFEAETIRRMVGHYRVFLEGIVSSPDQHLSQLPLMSERDRLQVLVDWNRTDTDCPKDVCLHQLFEAQAERTPDAVAVVFQSQRLTYAQLNAEADRLARDLRTAHVGPETLVGVYMERSVEMLIALLGILKAGGAYVPLDPAHPAARVRTMLEDARVPLVLTQERLLGRLPETDAIPRCLDRNGDVALGERTGNVQSGVKAENLAYVIFTSGSTGKPKGVQIEHRNVVNFIESMQKEPGLRSDDALLAVTTLSFDISLLELFLPLTVGARIVIADREEVMDGEQLLQKLTREHVTAMQATPATWQLMLQTGWEERLPLKVLCGGEAMPPELAHKLKTRCRELWNVYGPTETAVWSTVYRVEKVEEPAPVGRPIANTQVYILDEALRPVPIGVRGELYIGGDGVARGYLNRPELTADRFVPDPFGQAPGARFYKTGDVARYRPDGCIEVLGRSDFQVKIRGFRIELGEIEASLLAHPGLRQAAALAREDKPGEKQLVAYFVAAEESAPSFDDLRRFLKEKLPEYMVPSAFVAMQSLPLTPNGKLDRTALPAPGRQRQLQEAYVPPRSATECAIVEIWRSVLDLEKIGIHDDFFELGGHSLLATQVVARLRKHFGLQLPLHYMFESPTVIEMADRIEALRWARERGGAAEAAKDEVVEGSL